MVFKRVHIVGGAGSGKTTLANGYAKQHRLAHYELDEIYYSNVPTRVRRRRAERKGLLSEIVEADRWVLDGIFWQPWIKPALARADKIIVLAIPELARHQRVVKRHFRLLQEAPLSDWPTFFPTLFELLKHNHLYDTGPLHETMELLTGFEDKVEVFTTNEAAGRFLGLH